MIGNGLLNLLRGSSNDRVQLHLSHFDLKSNIFFFILGASSEEVKELKNQLKSAETKKQRLIEAFKKTSSDFREVSYRLTGK